MLNLTFEVLCAKIKVDAFIIIMKELKGSLLNIFDFFFIYIFGESCFMGYQRLTPTIGCLFKF